MSEEQARAWLCKGKHVLGMVARNGSGIRQLWLYREAIDEEGEEPAEVEVMAVVEGLCMDVRCSICGEVRTWAPGEEAIRKLLEGRGKTVISER
jgi:hypothetical protein